MLKLLLGRSGAGKSEAILRRIGESAGARAQILVVPEQHSHDTERRLCAVAGNSVSRWAEVLSFTRMAGRVCTVTGGQAAPTLDAGGRILLMHCALRSVSGTLRVFTRPSRKPEFLSGLAATVDELKSCCVTPAQLWTAGIESEGEEGDKLRDLSLIYGAYDALTAHRAQDPRDRITRLADGLRESRWAAGTDIYLDGFTDFTPQEMLVLRQLMGQAASVTVALTCDGLETDDEEIFSPARRTARALLRAARENAVPWESETLSIPRGIRTDALERVEAELFSPGAGPTQAQADGITLFEANSPYSEVEYAAAEILRLVREEGYRFREITVAARSMEEYGELIRTIFTRYGIPVFLSGMSDVLQKPVLALVTSALAAVAGDYAYDDLFRYLKTGLTGISQEERDLLENYVLKWDIRGSRWSQKGDWTMHPRGYGLPFREEDGALLTRLNEVRRKLIAPLERLRKNEERTGLGQAKALFAYLEEIDLPRSLAVRAQALRSRGDAALAEEYAQLWDILCNALEQCARILGDEPMESEEFSRLFTLVLSQYDVGSIPVSLDRLTAGEMPRLAHKRCRALFLLGADDGAIPHAAPSPGLLNDDDRSLLASYGLELAPSLTDKLGREMTILYETCALPTERLAVSWAAAGAGGEEKRPAFPVARLRALFPGVHILREGALDGSFRLAAPRPALELAGRFPAAAQALRRLDAYAPLVERMEGAGKLERGHLGQDAVGALYGRRVPMSASRMDKYKSCHFSYFMQYGLRAEPRQSAGFRAPEYGTFVHYVLEHVIAREDWRTGADGIDRKRLRAAVEETVERYVAQELGGLEKESARFRYLFGRLLKSVYTVAENVAEELARSDFRPIAFELGFGEGKDLPPVELKANGITVSISGFVDRVDGWTRDGRLHLRVVDYKTGRKSFDLTDIWNGLGLQMLLYLFTLERKGSDCFGAEEIVPSGALYLPARDAVVAGSRTMSEAARRQAVDRELRRRGLVLDDADVLEAMEHPGSEGIRFLPVKVSAKTGAISGDALVSAERLGRLERHIEKILKDICAELAAGNIAADPFWKGPENNACRYCDYAAACHFEEGRGADRRRWLPTVNAEEFWAGVE